jgi:hypothetical protein
MSTEDKKWIEQRLNEVDCRIGAVHPEFFITAETNNLIYRRYDIPKNKIVEVEVSILAGKLFHILGHYALN